MTERRILMGIGGLRRAWRSYRTSPLSRQFELEWYAFGVVAFAWGCFCIALAVWR